MNWTGGHLQRHSTTSKSAIGSNIQKQWFANGQQKLKRGKPSSRIVNIDSIASPVEHRKQAQPRLKSPNPRMSGALPLGSTTRHVWEDDLVRDVRRSFETSLINTDSPQHSILRQGTLPCTPGYNNQHQRTPERSHTGIRVRKNPVFPEDRSGNDVSRKRRRLLDTDDWVGMGTLRPQRPSYIPPKHDGNIGKRRATPRSSQPHYHNRRARSSHLGSSIRSINHKGSLHWQVPLLEDKGSSISTGLYNFTSIPESSLVSDKVPSRGRIVSSAALSATCSSDIMLLDDSEPPDFLLDLGNAVNTGKNRQLSRIFSQRTKQAHAGDTGSSNQYSSLPSWPIGGARPRSASLPLHHPVPMRMSKLLSSQLEDVCSTRAQAEQPQPVTSTSQDTEMWKQWIVSPRNKDSRDSISSSQNPESGKSTLYNSPETSMLPPSHTDVQIADGLAASHQTLHRRGLDGMICRSTMITKSQETESQSLTKVDSSSSLRNPQIADDGKGLQILGASATAQAHVKGHEDPEAIWRTFVFGSDEERDDI